MAPFDADFGWTRTEVSVVFTIAILSVGSWFVVAGFLQDRFGPQKVAAFGGILYALGFFLASQTESLIWLYVTFGAIAGAGNGFGYAIPIPVCSKWFPDRPRTRGRPGGRRLRRRLRHLRPARPGVADSRVRLAGNDAESPRRSSW